MKTVKILGDALTKVSDTSTVFDFRLWNEGLPQDVTGKTVSFTIANDSGYLFDVPAVIDGNVVSLDFSNELLKQLTPDTYHMEVSVTNSDGDVEVYPSQGTIDFRVGKNLHSTQGKLVPQITFDTVLRSVDEKIVEYTKTIAKGDKGDTGPQGPKGDMDLSQIAVGGRNLFLGTKNFSGNGNWSNAGDLVENVYQGLDAIQTASAWGGPKYNNSALENQGVIQSVDDTFIMSAWIRNTGTTPIDIYFLSEFVIPANYKLLTLSANSGWVRMKTIPFNFTQTSGLTRTLRFEPNTSPTNGYVQQAGLKLEKGNIATDWSPAPEDVPSNDSQLVHKTGNEVLAGDKTFTGNTTLATTTILAGNYGLRVTSSGFQKTTDGRTWVSANI